MSNSDLQHLYESGADGDIEMNGNSINNVLPPLTRNDTGAFLSQPGSSTWTNRSYEGYEIIDTATTYNIGSGADFDDLATAANTLQGLILEQDLTLQLQENITVSTGVEFKNLISAGGDLVIDLNTYTWELSSGDPVSVFNLLASIPFVFKNGTIKISTPNTKPVWNIFTVNNFRTSLTLQSDLTIDCSGNAYNKVCEVQSGKLFWWNPTEANVGSIQDAIVNLKGRARGGANGGDPSTQSIECASIWVNDNGTIVGG